MVDFVGTVDIHRQADDVGQGNFGDFVLFQQRGGGFGAADRAFDLFAAGGKGFDEIVDGGARADADVFVVGHKFHRFFTCHAFQIVLCRHVSLLLLTFGCSCFKRNHNRRRRGLEGRLKTYV